METPAGGSRIFWYAMRSGVGSPGSTRKITPHFYLCGDRVSESTPEKPGEGLMAPRVALCAAHQANLVLELILGKEGTDNE